MSMTKQYLVTNYWNYNVIIDNEKATKTFEFLPPGLNEIA